MARTMGHRYRRFVVAMVAGVVVLMGNAPASARQEVASGVITADPLRVAGPGVAFTEDVGTNGAESLRYAVAGEPVRELASGLERSQCEGQICNTDSFDFDASESVLAFSQMTEHQIGPSLRSFSSYAGALNGPYTPLQTCTGSNALPAYPYSVDGDAIAYFSDTCTDGLPGARIVVRDLAAGPGAPRNFAVSGDANFVLAGQFLALQEGRAIEVFDTLTGARSYSAAFGGQVFDIDAQADGTIVVALARSTPTGPPLPGHDRPTSCGVNIAWASASEPVAHVLPSAETEM